MRTIMRLTLLEMLKKKILYLTILLTIAFLSLYGTALHYAYRALPAEDAIIRLSVSGQLMSMGLYVTAFITAFLSVFASIGGISAEIEQGTLDAILSKPIHRYEVVLGRYFGILLLLIPYVTLLFSGVVGMNLFFGRGIVANMPAASVAGSLAVLWLLPVLLASVGIYFSTFLSTIGSGITVVILYLIGMVGGIMEQIGHFIRGDAKEVLTNIGILTSLLIPSDIIYRKSSALLFTTASGMNLSLENMLGAGIQPSRLMMAYIVLYCIFMITLAVRRFNARDI